MPQDLPSRRMKEPRPYRFSAEGRGDGLERPHSVRRQRSLAVDLLTGALAGAAGVWAMDRLDWFNHRRGLDTARSRDQTRRARPDGMDPAHAIAAEAAHAAGADLSPGRFESAGRAVHYAIGMVPGALYGALRGHLPYLDAGRGGAFGLGLFLAQDELLNTAAGFAGRPQDYPWQAHARPRRPPRLWPRH